MDNLVNRERERVKRMEEKGRGVRKGIKNEAKGRKKRIREEENYSCNQVEKNRETRTDPKSKKKKRRDETSSASCLSPFFFFLSILLFFSFFLLLSVLFSLPSNNYIFIQLLFFLLDHWTIHIILLVSILVPILWIISQPFKDRQIIFVISFYRSIDWFRKEKRKKRERRKKQNRGEKESGSWTEGDLVSDSEMVILSLSIHSSYPFLCPFIQEKMREKDRKERMFSLSGQFQEKVVMNHKEKNDHLCPGSFPCLCPLQTWMKLNWSQMKVCTSWRETTIRLFFPSGFHSENFSATFSSVSLSLSLANAEEER